MTQTFSNVLCTLYFVVADSIIMYLYYVPLQYVPWTSSLDGYVRNINVAIIINIIILPQFWKSDPPPPPTCRSTCVLVKSILTPNQIHTRFLWTIIDRTGQDHQRVISLCCCVTRQLLLSLRLGLWPSESGTSEIVAKRRQTILATFSKEIESSKVRCETPLCFTMRGYLPNERFSYRTTTILNGWLLCPTWTTIDIKHYYRKTFLKINYVKCWDHISVMTSLSYYNS